MRKKMLEHEDIFPQNRSSPLTEITNTLYEAYKMFFIDQYSLSCNLSDKTNILFTDYDYLLNLDNDARNEYLRKTVAKMIFAAAPTMLTILANLCTPTIKEYTQVILDKILN